MRKFSKNLKKANEVIDKEKSYTISEAIKLSKQTSYEKFDPTITVSFNLNLDPKKSEQQLRGSIVLPKGTGKDVKVLFVGDTNDRAIAKKSGADYAEDTTILNKIKKDNWFDFDFIVTTPKMMQEFAKFGKVLGPKGLMPNPKLGTVTNDIEKSISDIKKGQVEYRTDKQGIISVRIGKKSFDDKSLIENYNSLYTLIKSLRPATVKGDFFITIAISTTMGPAVLVEKV